VTTAESPTPAADTPVVDPTRSMRTTFKGVATLVAPTTAVTALLYYFGWARTSVEASVLGLDDSLFGYSTQDYLLRSISSMFYPLAVGLVVAFVGLVAHAALLEWVERAAAQGDPNAMTAPAGLDARQRRRLRGLAIGVGAVAIVALVLGAVGAADKTPTRMVSIGAPLCVTIGLALLGYAVHVYRRFVARASERRVGAEIKGLRLLSASLATLLILLSLFWTVSHYAGVKGVDLALLVERTMPSRPDVTIYSAKRLHLQPPVEEKDLGDDGSAYRFSYSGLKLMFRAGHSYFLRPSDPSASDRNIIIPESNDLRIELVRA